MSKSAGDSLNAPIKSVDETTALLIRARSFVARGWCRYRQAEDSNGDRCYPFDDRAVAWCAYGALLAAGLQRFNPPYAWHEHPAIVRFHAATGGELIDHFNNRHEIVEPVLAAFDRAIAAGQG